MADEGVHEIQLNGKQLVFLFMASTVVLVVVFLCGVMVGRGVPASGAVEAAAADAAAIDPTRPAAPSLRTADGTPISAQETLTYAERLGSPTPADESLRDPPPSRVPPEPASEPVDDAPVDGLFAEPPGDGHAVQVMATVTRAEAETVARRLDAKGYPVFISVAGGAAPAQFRIRVGKYNDRREAEAIALRLKTEEQFDTWLTR